MTHRDGTRGISPLLDLLADPHTLLPKRRRVLETLTFLAANPTIAYSICEVGGVALLLQVVADPDDGVQLEAAETLQALMVHQSTQVQYPKQYLCACLQFWSSSLLHCEGSDNAVKDDTRLSHQCNSYKPCTQLCRSCCHGM